jgi:hypothetical protein
MIINNQAEWQNIALHNRGCECHTCCPWANHNTTGPRLPCTIIYISKKEWQRLGCPGTIEDYYTAIRSKSFEEGRTYKYENGEFKPL